MPSGDFRVLPFPGNFLARRLHTFTEPVRAQLPADRRHPYRGTGVFDACCSPRRFESWERDGSLPRIVTAVRALVGGATQGAVWLVAGVLAGAAAGVVGLVQGREAARLILARHYTPALVAITILSVAGYLAVLAGGVLLLRRLA